MAGAKPCRSGSQHADPSTPVLHNEIRLLASAPERADTELAVRLRRERPGTVAQEDDEDRRAHKVAVVTAPHSRDR